MKTINGVVRLVLRGGAIEFQPARDLVRAVRFEEEKATEVEHLAESHVLTLKGYLGKVQIPEKTPLQIVVEDAQITGTIGAGGLKVGDVDVTVKQVAGGGGLIPHTRLEHIVCLIKDVVGIVGATVIFCMLFMSVGLAYKDYIAWEVVLGAGAYFGFSGRWLVSLLIAIGAIVMHIVQSPEGAKEWKVFGKALVKLVVYLLIMGVGKWIRDYLDRYIRGGYTGMKNKVQ